MQPHDFHGRAGQGRLHCRETLGSLSVEVTAAPQPGLTVRSARYGVIENESITERIRHALRSDVLDSGIAVELDDLTRISPGPLGALFVYPDLVHDAVALVSSVRN